MSAFNLRDGQLAASFWVRRDIRAGRWRRLTDSVLQEDAWFEGLDLSGGYRYRHAGQGVPSFAVRLFPDDIIYNAWKFLGFCRLKVAMIISWTFTSHEAS